MGASYLQSKGFLWWVPAGRIGEACGAVKRFGSGWVAWLPYRLKLEGAATFSSFHTAPFGKTPNLVGQKTRRRPVNP